MSHAPECPHFTCAACGHDICADERPSPGEGEGLCAECWDIEVAEGKLRGRDYEAWAAL